MRVPATASALLVASISLAPQRQSRATIHADCNAPAKDAIVMVDVRENVFQALPTADGC